MNNKKLHVYMETNQEKYFPCYYFGVRDRGDRLHIVMSIWNSVDRDIKVGLFPFAEVTFSTILSHWKRLGGNHSISKMANREFKATGHDGFARITEDKVFEIVRYVARHAFRRGYFNKNLIRDSNINLRIHRSYTLRHENIYMPYEREYDAVE